MDRRRYLQLVGLGCGLGIAGCLSGEESASTASSSTGRVTPGATSTTPTETPTPTYEGERYSTVFLGNSYTARNDLPGRYQSVLRHTPTYETRPLTTRAVTSGGRRLQEHVSQLDSGDVASVLGGNGPSWDTVVLQEQSQIPGFSPRHQERERSLDAAVTLAGVAAARDARTVLFMTWGRRTGDEMNPQLYPDFETMQRRLAAGYRAMADRIESAGHPVRIAPVGLAFQAVHDTVAASGTDPATEGTAFWELYAGDGSHPSLQGTYLAALTVAGTATGISPTDVSYAPDSIGQDRVSLLREAATTALQS